MAGKKKESSFDIRRFTAHKEDTAKGKDTTRAGRKATATINSYLAGNKKKKK